MNVISFSLWGNNPAFQQGALENIHLAQKHYPGWQCVFFLREDEPEEFQMQLKLAGGLVHLKPQIKGEWEGLFWRFEPISDSQVRHTLSRDCDSRLNPREAAAVNEWLHSRHFFHSMRDHYEHNVPIMGGMFGCHHWPKFGELLATWTDFSAKGCDQTFLSQKVWPEMRTSTLAHDRHWSGLRMPNRDGNGMYEYKPWEQLGDHALKGFPDHEPLIPEVHGEHVGARVNVVSS